MSREVLRRELLRAILVTGESFSKAPEIAAILYFISDCMMLETTINVSFRE
jgi:hypothetical protein